MKKETLEKNWKYYLGLLFLSLSLILPLFGFLVPFLPMSVAMKATLIALLSVGGPEVMIILAVICLGKEFILHFKNRIRNFFRIKKVPETVSKTRYYIGLFLLFFSSTPLYLAAYSPQILPEDETIRFLLTMSGDLVFVLSFFILGANFWEKFKSLFIWDGNSKAP